MAREGTLVDPPGVPSCAVCGNPDCGQFPHPPYPADYPFLPDHGGYGRHASQDVQPKPIRGSRRTKALRCRS